MTYTGEMVLPRNAVMMQEEEMRYVEGGKKLTKKQCKSLANWTYAGSLTAGLISLISGVLGNAIAAVLAGFGGTALQAWSRWFDKAATRHKGAKVWKSGISLKRQFVG